jgi:hypothetical protein
MAKTNRGGIVVAPHHLASEAGRRVLADGGTAMEAGVAIAATLAVVYPHSLESRPSPSTPAAGRAPASTWSSIAARD